MELQQWPWLFLFFYIAIMLGIGLLTKPLDDQHLNSVFGDWYRSVHWL